MELFLTQVSFCHVCGHSASKNRRTAGPLHFDGYRTQSEAGRGTDWHCIQPDLQAGKGPLTESDRNMYGMMRACYTSLDLIAIKVAGHSYICTICTGIFAGITTQAKFTDQADSFAC